MAQIFNIQDHIISEKSLPQLKTFADELGSDVVHIYPFDCSPLDISYGGGIAAGRVYETFAWESTGKSTWALEVCKSFSKYWTARGKEHIIVWQEVESSLDRIRAAYMGLPIKKFIISETETLEQMGSIIHAYCEKSKATGIKVLYVVDTTAALETDNEANPKQKKNDQGIWVANQYSGGMMERPRVFRQVLKKVVKPLGQTDGTLIMCNQIYKNTQPYQDDQAPGGGGPKFYSSVRTKLSVTGPEVIKLSDGTEKVVGIRVNFKHVKNKITLPKQEVEVIISGEEGFDKFLTLYTYLLDRRFFKVAGSWKTFNIPTEFGNVASEPTMTEVKFQNPNHLKELLQMQYPQGFDWMDYLVYQYNLSTSPLLKIKLINTVWDYEMKFFGKKVTELTEHEKETVVLARQIEDQD